jgi:23S rRNA pseudouridine2605 synthase
LVRTFGTKKHNTEVRLAKRIASSENSRWSRRDAEGLIDRGIVTVNGKQITTPAMTVTASDNVKVNGKLLPPTPPIRLWALNKVGAELVTRDDPSGRRTIWDGLSAIRALPKNLIAVGRLDYTTKGLLLLTNDGDLSRQLEHPSNAMARVYRARVHGKIDDWKFEALRRGVRDSVSGVRFKPMEAVIERPPRVKVKGVKGATKGKAKDAKGGANTWLVVSCSEGKNRQVKRSLAAVGLTVNALIRLQFGPYKLNGLPSGAIQEVKLKYSSLKLLKEDKPAKQGNAKNSQSNAKNSREKKQSPRA